MIAPCLAALAFLCSALSSFWCDTISFDVSNDYNRSSSGGVTPQHFQLGPWSQRETEIVQVNAGGGESYLFVRDVCRSLPSGVDVDGKWKAVRAFSVIALLWGGALTVIIFFANCSYFLSDVGWKGVAVQLAVAVTLCQGLTFLLLDSNACSTNPLLAATPPAGFSNAAYTALIESVYEPECSWGAGMTTNVVATVCWFLAGTVMLVVGVPTAPPREPPETQQVTYERTVRPDGTVGVVETAVVKGTAVPPAPALPSAEPGGENLVAENP